MSNEKKGFITGEVGYENKNIHNEIMNRVAAVRRSVGYLEKEEVSLQTVLYFMCVDANTAEAVGILAHTKPQIKSDRCAINDLVADVKKINNGATIGAEQFKILKKIAVAIGGRRDEDDYHNIINFFKADAAKELIIEMVKQDDQNGDAVIIKIPTIRGIKNKTYDDLTYGEKIHKNLWVYAQYNVLNAHREVLKQHSITDEEIKETFTNKIIDARKQYLDHLLLVNDYSQSIRSLVDEINVDEVNVRWGYWLNKNI